MRSIFIGLVIALGSIFINVAMADTTGGTPHDSHAPHAPILNSFGERIVFLCQVPVDTDESVVNLEMTIGDDLSLDFVTITLNDLKQSYIFFTQLPKGQLAKDIKSGQLEYLVLTEETAQSEGVVRQSGYLMISKDDTGNFSGLISAVGNVYPLNCEAK